MYQLVIEDDEGNRKQVPIIRDSVTIGRKDGNTIVLNERNVSRNHAKLVKESNHIFIEDVASRYGIKKNGKKIGPKASFKKGDVILIGDFKLTLLVKNKNKAKVQVAQPPLAEQTGIRAKPTRPAKPTAAPAPVADEQTAQLAVVSSNFAGQKFNLTHATMVIGRTEDNDIIIDHRSISRNHAKIVREEGRYKVVDLGSANGVKVNGETYHSIDLRKGDIIELGHVRFRYVEPGENFQFKPAAVDPVSLATPSKGKGKLIGIISGVGVVLTVIVAFILFGNNDKKDPSEAKNETAETQETGLRETQNTTNKETNNPPPETTDPQPDLQKVTEMLEEGRRALGEEDWEKASETFNQVLQLDPGNTEARRERDRADNEKPFKKMYNDTISMLESQKYKDAVRHSKMIPPQSAYAERIKQEKILEKCYHGMLDKTNGYVKAKRWRKVIEIANEVIEENNNSDTPSRSALNRANKLKKQARNELKPVRPPEPTAAEKKAKAQEILKNKCIPALRFKNNNKILTDCKEVLKYYNLHPAAVNVAKIYDKRGDSKNAIKYFKLAIKVAPGGLKPGLEKKINQLVNQ